MDVVAIEAHALGDEPVERRRHGLDGGWVVRKTNVGVAQVICRHTLSSGSEWGSEGGVRSGGRLLAAGQHAPTSTKRRWGFEAAAATEASRSAATTMAAGARRRAGQSAGRCHRPFRQPLLMVLIS